LFLQFLILKKTIRIDKKIWVMDQTINDIMSNEFQQMQSMHSLQLLLKLNYPLASVRGWAGSPDFLLQIAKASCKAKPSNVLECSSGTSTVVLARTMQINGAGHVYSLESDPEFAEKTREELHHQGLTDFATVIDAPLVAHSVHGEHFEWYSLDKLPPLSFDMLVIDGPPAQLNSQARYPALPLLSKHLCAGALVYLDDAARGGEQKIVSRWCEEFPAIKAEHITAEKGLVKIIWQHSA
jgi:predicted O-methyltransferase YrrM